MVKQFFNPWIMKRSMENDGFLMILLIFWIIHLLNQGFKASNCSLYLGFSQDGTGKSVPWQWKSPPQLMISCHPLWSIFMYFSS